MKIQKQREVEKQRLLDELNKRQLCIIGKKSNFRKQYLSFIFNGNYNHIYILVIRWSDQRFSGVRS
jgi:hypothetical protein